MGAGFSATLLAVSWTEFAAGSLLMAGRLYVGAFITRRFQADWWWALFTYICAICAQIAVTVAVYYGLGEHVDTLSRISVDENQLTGWIFTTFAITSIWMGKCAIIAFILQIEGSSIIWWRKWSLIGLGLSNAIFNIVLYPIVWMQCFPADKIWDDSVRGNCHGRILNSHYGTFQGSYSAFVDFALAVYPMVVFYNLQLQLHIKVGLCILFSFGIVAMICASLKVRMLASVGTSTDITFDTGKLDIWATTEMWVVVIVSCVPTNRPLFIRFFKKAYNNSRLRSLQKSGYIQQSDTGTPGTPYRSPVGNTKSSSSKPTTNDSEENILEDNDGIIMSNNFSARYERPSKAVLSDSSPRYKHSCQSRPG